MLNPYDLEQLAAQKQEAMVQEALLLHRIAAAAPPSFRERLALRLVAVALRLAPSLRDEFAAPARVPRAASS